MPTSKHIAPIPRRGVVVNYVPRFDRIFHRRTGFVTLDGLLERLNANKSELLMVLDRPETPLHTNGSERDIRCQSPSTKSVAALAVTTDANVAMHSLV
jgi:hypothetical protein